MARHAGDAPPHGSSTLNAIHRGRAPRSAVEHLEDRFKHEESIYLPRAQADLSALRVLDFPIFLTYDSELYRIVAQLKLCDTPITEAELINKTLNSFPPACAILL